MGDFIHISLHHKYQVFNLSDYEIIKIKMFSFNVLFQLQMRLNFLTKLVKLI